MDDMNSEIPKRMLYQTSEDKRRSKEWSVVPSRSPKAFD